MTRPARHPAPVARDPPARDVAQVEAELGRSCAAGDHASAASFALMATPPKRAVAIDAKHGRAVRELLGRCDVRVDAAEDCLALDEHLPGGRDGHVDAAPGRGERERRSGGVEDGLAQIEVDAAEHHAHRAAPQRRRPAGSLDTSDADDDHELVGGLVADAPAPRKHLSQSQQRREHGGDLDGEPHLSGLLCVDTPQTIRV